MENKEMFNTEDYSSSEAYIAPKVGDYFPFFDLKAVSAGKVPSNLDDAFCQINNQTYKDKYIVLFFWPKDFTFVCPTEIEEFNHLNEEFEKRNTQLLGASIDSEFVHLAWKKHHSGLSELKFPMLSDIKRELSESLNIIDENEGVSQRATFIIDPEGIIRFISITDLNIGRNPQEVLRVLDALQNGGLTPCNWKPGQKTIEL